MAKLGTREKPAIMRVQTAERAQEVLELANERGIVAVVGLEPDHAEDISDLERALNPPAPQLAAPRVGRNELCPCGSGKKFKKCHGA